MQTTRIWREETQWILLQHRPRAFLPCYYDHKLKTHLTCHYLGSVPRGRYWLHNILYYCLLILLHQFKSIQINSNQLIKQACKQEIKSWTIWSKLVRSLQVRSKSCQPWSWGWGTSRTYLWCHALFASWHSPDLSSTATSRPLLPLSMKYPWHAPSSDGSTTHLSAWPATTVPSTSTPPWPWHGSLSSDLDQEIPLQQNPQVLGNRWTTHRRYQLRGNDTAHLIRHYFSHENRTSSHLHTIHVPHSLHHIRMLVPELARTPRNTHGRWHARSMDRSRIPHVLYYSHHQILPHRPPLHILHRLHQGWNVAQYLGHRIHDRCRYPHPLPLLARQ